MSNAAFKAREPFYSTSEWLELRERILMRDGARCRNCGHSEWLQVHHWLPEHEHFDTHDGTGYGFGPNPLLVHESGLVTLCRECHQALTNIRIARSVKRDPHIDVHNQNIFQLWALAGKQVPFKAFKETWSGRTGQFMLVERVEIKTWPFGVAWGRYCDGAEMSESTKIANAGTYTWAFYQDEQ